MRQGSGKRPLGSWLPCVLLLLLGALNLVAFFKPVFWDADGGVEYTDLGILLGEIADYQATGRLYDLERPDYFDPGSSVFKYPPSCAAFLLATTDAPKDGQAPEADEVVRLARPLIVLSLGALAGTLALVFWLVRPSRPRALLMVAAFSLWAPHAESILGPQFEPLILLLLALSLAAIVRGGTWSAGLPIGIAGALKIYPWMIAPFFLLRRDWVTLLGLALAATVALAVSGLALPLGMTWTYLTQILPRMGGLTLNLENLSVAANLGRLSLGLAGTELPRHGGWSIIVSPADSSLPLGLRLLTWGGTALAAVALITLSVRAVRRAAHLPAGRRDGLAFCLAVCVLLLLMPTSWANYQCLLALPLILAIGLAAPRRCDRTVWLLIAIGIILGALTTDDVVRRRMLRLLRQMGTPATLLAALQDILRTLRGDSAGLILATLRSFLPLVVWLGLLRVLRAVAPSARGSEPLDVPAGSAES